MAFCPEPIDYATVFGHDEPHQCTWVMQAEKTGFTPVSSQAVLRDGHPRHLDGHRLVAEIRPIGRPAPSLSTFRTTGGAVRRLFSVAAWRNHLTATPYSEKVEQCSTFVVGVWSRESG